MTGDYICGLHAHCNNTVGSYECVCDDGYEELEDGHAEDVNKGCVGKCACVLACVYMAML